MILEQLFFLIYRLVLAPLARFLLICFAPVLTPKLRETVRGKREQRFTTKEMESLLRARRPLWIHAASGEIEYAKPLLRALHERAPDVPLLVTYSSPSALRMIQGIPELAAWGPAPWESSLELRNFIDRFQPRGLLVARTDLWPLMIHEAHRAQIPSLLFAATFAKNSSRLRGFSKYLTRFSLRRLSALQVVSAADLENLSDCVLSMPMEIAGDTRFDQVFHRLEHPKPLNDSLKPQVGPVLIAGSTWPEDEAPLLEALSQSSAWRMILVPHEVHQDHLDLIKETLKKKSMSFRLYSDGGPWTEKVLIVNQVGFLAELYAWGDLAFVGGSFKKQVHSVMEPLAAGLRVIVGPSHLNNREALHFREVLCEDDPLVLVALDSKDLKTYLENPDLIHHQHQIKSLVKTHQGATDHALTWLHKNNLI